MEITPIVTPDLYMSMSMLFVATVCFRMAVDSLIRARRARVTLRRVPNVEPAQGRLPSNGMVSEHRTTL
jgi:hypothetical protein